MKTYVKPALFCEHFELSQHVASCAYDLNQAVNSCESFSADLKGEIWGVLGTIYADAAKGCEDTNVQNYCYQANGVDGIGTFNS